jgi:hypothetical protein
MIHISDDRRLSLCRYHHLLLTSSSRPATRAYMSRHRRLPIITALIGLLIMLSGAGYAASQTIHSRTTKSSRGHMSGTPVVRAYALVTPTCDTCLPPLHYNPLDISHSANITLDSSLRGAPSGTWCFVLGNGTPSTATVVASTQGEDAVAPPRSPTSAQWIVGAPDCVRHQIEVQTFRYTFNGTSLIAVHDHGIPFSFVVLQTQ